jgi:membrane protease YdiL (CAAX protease family)
MRTTRLPSPLVSGAVRAWHIVFLWAVIYAVTDVFSYKVTQSADPELRYALRLSILQALTVMLVITLTLIVPELRRSIPLLYSRAAAHLSATEVLLLLALLVTWADGAYRLLVEWPLLIWHPDLYSTLKMVDRPPSVGPIFLALILVTAAVIAPLGEELLFRGFMQNLLVHRWGLWPGITLASIVFGLGHGEHALSAAVSGVFFSLVYCKYRSLWPSTLLHAVSNLVVIALFLGTPLSTKPEIGTASLSNWVPEIILTIAFFPLLFLFWRRFRPSA